MSGCTACRWARERGTPSFTVVRGAHAVGPPGGRRSARRRRTSSTSAIGDAIRLADPAAADGVREAVVVGEVLLPVFDDNPFNEGVALTPETLDGGAPRATGFDQYVVDLRRRGRRARPRPAGCARCSPRRSPCTPSRRRRPTSPTSTACSSCPASSACSSACWPLAAVGHALATSVRRRRHDLGIVRSLGFVARDVLRTIAAQSWTMVRRRARRRDPARDGGGAPRVAGRRRRDRGARRGRARRSSP